MEAQNSSRLEYFKEKCMDNRNFCTRSLSRIQTEEELLDFVTRRQIDIPGFSPNFYASAPCGNQYRITAEIIFTPIKNHPQTPFSFPNNEPPPPQRQIPRSQIDENLRDLLVSEIGRKWKQFGRAMNISEGFLDELEERHPKRLQERLQDILKEVLKKENALPRIKVALEKIGRMDLAVKIIL